MKLICETCGFCSKNQSIIKTYVYKNGLLVKTKKEYLCGKKVK